MVQYLSDVPVLKYSTVPGRNEKTVRWALQRELQTVQACMSIVRIVKIPKATAGGVSIEAPDTIYFRGAGGLRY